MEKFLIINPFGIGDILFTVPLVKVLKERYPESRIGYWCNERVASLLWHVDGVDVIYPLSRGDLKRLYGRSPLKRFAAMVKLFSDMRRERYTATLDFSLDSRYAFMARLAGIRTRIGFNPHALKSPGGREPRTLVRGGSTYANRARFLTHAIPLEGYSGKHVIEYYSEVLNVLVGPRPDDTLRMQLSVTQAAAEKARTLLASLGIDDATLVIGMAPGGGASWGSDAVYKQWSPLNFAALARKILYELNGAVVLIGEAGERPIADIIRHSINHPRLIDLVGETDLTGLVSVVSTMKLLVANDGGPLHLAVALGVKTVSLFGPVDDVVYGPYPQDNHHTVVKKDLPCRPCYRHFRFDGCVHNKRCLEEITVDEVFAAVRALV